MFYDVYFQLFEEGLSSYTWQTEESADFIEIATSLVCMDVHRNLDIVQTNNMDIIDITKSWCKQSLDIFSSRNPQTTNSMQQLQTMARSVLSRSIKYP